MKKKEDNSQILPLVNKVVFLTMSDFLTQFRQNEADPENTYTLVNIGKICPAAEQKELLAGEQIFHVVTVWRLGVLLDGTQVFPETAFRVSGLHQGGREVVVSHWPVFSFQ